MRRGHLSSPCRWTGSWGWVSTSLCAVALTHASPSVTKGIMHQCITGREGPNDDMISEEIAQRSVLGDPRPSTDGSCQGVFRREGTRTLGLDTTPQPPLDGRHCLPGAGTADKIRNLPPSRDLMAFATFYVHVHPTSVHPTEKGTEQAIAFVTQG